MAQFRENVCEFYIAHENCKRNRQADMFHYCQRCREYSPITHRKMKNKKKILTEQVRKKESRNEFADFC